MQVSVAHSFQELDHRWRLAWREWDVTRFQHSIAWFEVLASHGLPDGGAPRLYLVSDAGQPVAALVCCVVPATRVLRSLTSFYTTEFGAAWAPGPASVPAAIAHAWAAAVAAERPRWDAIELRLLRSDDPLKTELELALHARGFSVRRYFQFETWFATTAAMGYDAYFAARPSQLRNTIARREKKLRREHAVDISVERNPGPALDVAIAAFEHVYRASWKQPEPCADFIAAMARAAAARGVLRLGVLRVDGAPAAAQLWLTTPTRATIYKLAYDEKYREWSVGSILSTTMFRLALDDDHVAEIDYGVGSEPYKRDWMSTTRQAEGLLAYNWRTPRGLAGALRERSAVLWNRWRHARRPPQPAATAGD